MRSCSKKRVTCLEAAIDTAGAVVTGRLVATRGDDGEEEDQNGDVIQTTKHSCGCARVNEDVSVMQLLKSRKVFLGEGAAYRKKISLTRVWRLK